jgi:hypothetical protein
MIFIKEKSMKNLFELSEEEKNQIRGLHESYKSKPGTSLNEQRGDLTGVPGREDNSKVNIPKWKNILGKWKNTGKLNFGTPDMLKEPLAILKLDDGNKYIVRYFTFLPGYSGPSTPSIDEKGKYLDEFNIPGDSLPFADNMVTSSFDKFPEAKKQFDMIVEKIVDYINAGGFDKLNNMTIQGSADSANPTLSVPVGYTELDHNPPYDGLTDLNQMNLFLAKKRAENYAAKLIEEVKTRTGKTLNIKSQTPISYLGKGESYRGPQFRSIKLTPNAPKLTVSEPTPKPKSRDRYAPEQLTEAKPVKITVTIDGKSEVMDGYSYPADENTLSVGVEIEKIGSIPNTFENMVDGKIENNTLSVTSKGVTNIIGEIKDGKPNINYDDYRYTVNKYSGPLTTTYDTKKVKFDGKEIGLYSIKDIYFTFQKI